MGGISRDVDPVTVCEDSGDNSIPRRVRVSQGVMQGLLSSKQPEQPRSTHLPGTVLMAMEISREGSACRILLIRGHPLLAPAAVDRVEAVEIPHLIYATASQS